jgi:hypothetical protein
MVRWRGQAGVAGSGWGEVGLDVLGNGSGLRDRLVALDALAVHHKELHALAVNAD